MIAEIHTKTCHSEIMKTKVVCKIDTYSLRILPDGRLVAWMGIEASVCPKTHADKIYVTTSIQHVDSCSIGEAYLTLVSINEDGRALTVVPIQPMSDHEQKQHVVALARMKIKQTNFITNTHLN